MMCVSCATVRLWPAVVSAGTAGIDPAASPEAVALDARELDERVRAGGHVRGHLRI